MADTATFAKDTLMIRNLKATRAALAMSMYGALLGAWTVLSACNRGVKCKEEGLQTVPYVEANIVLLDLPLASAKTRPQIDSLLAAYPAFAKGYLLAGAHGDTAARYFMERQSADPYLDTMRADIDRVYTPTRLNLLSKQMGDMLGHVKGYYPDFAPPAHTYAFCSGFEVDLLLQDSLLLIGPEFFMPDSAHYEPPQVPRLYKAAHAARGYCAWCGTDHL